MSRARTTYTHEDALKIFQEQLKSRCQPFINSNAEELDDTNLEDLATLALFLYLMPTSEHDVDLANQIYKAHINYPRFSSFFTVDTRILNMQELENLYKHPINLYLNHGQNHEQDFTHPLQHLFLSLCYENRILQAVDAESQTYTYVYWLEKSAHRNCAEAQFQYGLFLLYSPTSTEHQKETGKKFIRLAAIQQHPSALFVWGMDCLKRKQNAEAIDNIFQSARLSYKDAIKKIKKLYSEISGGQEGQLNLLLTPEYLIKLFYVHLGININHQTQDSAELLEIIFKYKNEPQIRRLCIDDTLRIAEESIRENYATKFDAYLMYYFGAQLIEKHHMKEGIELLQRAVYFGSAEAGVYLRSLHEIGEDLEPRVTASNYWRIQTLRNSDFIEPTETQAELKEIYSRDVCNQSLVADLTSARDVLKNFKYKFTRLDVANFITKNIAEVAKASAEEKAEQTNAEENSKPTEFDEILFDLFIKRKKLELSPELRQKIFGNANPSEIAEILATTLNLYALHTEKNPIRLYAAAHILNNFYFSSEAAMMIASEAIYRITEEDKTESFSQTPMNAYLHATNADERSTNDFSHELFINKLLLDAHLKKHPAATTFLATRLENLPKSMQYEQIGEQESVGKFQDKFPHIYFYEFAIALDDAEANLHLGRCYLNGIGVEKNQHLAKNLFTKAAELGITEAFIYLGEMHENEGNLRAAITCFSNAAKKNYQPARNHLFSMLKKALPNEDMVRNLLANGFPLDFELDDFGNKTSEIAQWKRTAQKIRRNALELSR